VAIVLFSTQIGFMLQPQTLFGMWVEVEHPVDDISAPFRPPDVSPKFVGFKQGGFCDFTFGRTFGSGVYRVTGDLVTVTATYETGDPPPTETFKISPNRQSLCLQDNVGRPTNIFMRRVHTNPFASVRRLLERFGLIRPTSTL
jgi:hypothetical protein